jgi:hypothetical protein
VPPAEAGARLVIDRLAQGTIVAVNLAFKVAAANGEVLLVDDDACGGPSRTSISKITVRKADLDPERARPAVASRPSRADVAA